MLLGPLGRRNWQPKALRMQTLNGILSKTVVAGFARQIPLRSRRGSEVSPVTAKSLKAKAWNNSAFRPLHHGLAAFGEPLSEMPSEIPPQPKTAMTQG